MPNPQSTPTPPSPGVIPETTIQPTLSPSLVSPASASEPTMPAKTSRLICDDTDKPCAYIITGLPMPPPPVTPDALVDGKESPATK